MSEQDQSLPSSSGTDEQSPPLNTSNFNRRRRTADNTIKDQDAVRDYLTFKQTRGLMSESEKRLLDKIAAVCGMANSIDCLGQSGSTKDSVCK